MYNSLKNYVNYPNKQRTAANKCVLVAASVSTLVLIWWWQNGQVTVWGWGPNDAIIVGAETITIAVNINKINFEIK